MSFLNSYKLKLLQSFRSQKQARLSFSLKALVFIFFISLLYVLIAIAAAPSYAPEKHFYEDTGMISVLSGFLLFLTGILAGAIFVFLRKSQRFQKFFWLLSSMGFVFFSLDEVYAFHEHWGDVLKNSFLGESGFFRNWNDVLVIIYGIVALISMIYFLPEILRYPKFDKFLIPGFVFYALQTLIDSIVRKPSSFSIIIEESFKLWSSMFCALAFAYVFYWVTKKGNI